MNLTLAISGWLWALLIIVGLIVLVFVYFASKFVRLWIQAWTSGANVGMLDMIAMQFRKVDPTEIVESRIMAVQSGIEMPTAQLQSHYMAVGKRRGRVMNVVQALIAANRAKIPLDWNSACAIDLAGRDIFDAVQTSVNPRVIDCPRGDAGVTRLDAVAKDGIRLLCTARVTVRANIQRLVGGATEDTVVARVGQAIVSAIGSAETYKHVLENPDEIARRALETGLDAGTAFEVLSVDIADISVAGVDQEANVGAKLQEEQAQADKRRFQAEAEKRRAMAVAQEQEFRAEEQKNRALVVLAEAEVPKAMAEAFRSGNMGVMDYMRYRNIQADTKMRTSISGEDQDKEQSDD